jgi:hypothetical protein
MWGEGKRQTYIPQGVETGDVGVELESIKVSLLGV